MPSGLACALLRQLPLLAWPPQGVLADPARHTTSEQLPNWNPMSWVKSRIGSLGSVWVKCPSWTHHCGQVVLVLEGLAWITWLTPPGDRRESHLYPSHFYWGAWALPKINPAAIIRRKDGSRASQPNLQSCLPGGRLLLPGLIAGPYLEGINGKAQWGIIPQSSGYWGHSCMLG